MATFQVFVNVKTIGKRKPALSATPYALSKDVRTLRDLITFVVKNEVSLYNSKELASIVKRVVMILPSKFM